MDFSKLDQKQITVLIQFPDDSPVRLLLGISEAATDELLGEHLKISFRDPETGQALEGDPCLILHGDQWDENLSVDTEHGRDYKMSLDARIAAVMLSTP